MFVWPATRSWLMAWLRRGSSSFPVGRRPFVVGDRVGHEGGTEGGQAVEGVGAVAGALGDAVEPVVEGVGVDAELLGGSVAYAVGRDEGVEGLPEHGLFQQRFDDLDEPAGDGGGLRD